MLRLKKVFTSLLAVVIAITLLSISAMATNTQPIHSALTKSIDTSFDLDFATSTYWTIDFDNNVFGPFNRKYVTIQYTSCNPATLNAKVSIELYIDSDKDGVYERCDPNGGYLYTLSAGEKYSFLLPYGNTVKNYRIVFGNQTSSVTSGTFSVYTE